MTFECWPLLASVRNGNKPQFPDWPVTVNMDDNDGRNPAGWLPERRFARNERPAVQGIEQTTGEVLYTVRATGRLFRSPVLSSGKFLIKLGTDRPRAVEFGPLEPGQKTTNASSL